MIKLKRNQFFLKKLKIKIKNQKNNDLSVMLINQITTLNFCMATMNFERIRDKKKKEKNHQ
jgi:hypothetical protein